jgi:hypothetical protein
METIKAAPAPHGFEQSRARTNEGRPAWARPQPSWPFRVIDPRSHTLGAPAQPAPGWSS